DEAIDDLLDRLYHKVAGEPFAPFNPDTLALLKSRSARLEAVLAQEAHAESAMTMAQQRFFHQDVALGLLVDQLQTQAALKLEEALAAPDTAHMWPLVLQARAPLEQLEIEL